MNAMNLIIALLVIFLSTLISADYQVGVGRADCTGPAAEIIFTGYAKLSQVGCGLHLRQFSRAYVIDDGQRRVVFVSIDAQSANYGVKRHVLRNLAAKYNDTYSESNFILSGTHTHNGPGGWHMDLLYDIPNLGFVKESFDALVDGITKSIITAHENMVLAKIFLSNGTVLEANINRSPAAYLYNPEAERARYEYNVDKELAQLKFVRSKDNKLIGAINWFAVHPTSMNNTNCLVSSDNVGYASILLESSVNKGSLPGTGDFVGTFASTNLGDVSPNIKGPICVDTGEECDFVTSTCNGRTETCIASGPGENMAESTKIIAGRIFNKAKELLDQDNGTEVTGPVKFVHQYVDMPNEKSNITLANGQQLEIQGCPPAMGYSFAGGTTDGPGDFDFTQGTKTDNPFWDAVRDFVFPPTDEEIACHAPKPILINTGGVNFPYEWQPRIVTTQIFLVGQVVLIAVPGEFTTMSGRRLREAVQEAVIKNGGPKNTKPILLGHSNVYTSYIATYEEYQLQRYEGASTIFGPHTLELYINKYQQLVKALFKGESLSPGPPPPVFDSQLLTLVAAARTDGLGLHQDFGDVIQQPPSNVTAGDVVVVKFVGGNPRNNRRQGGTYLTVERLEEKNWVVVANDANWETRYLWSRTNILIGQSEVTIKWEVGDDVPAGSYRIRHYGDHKTSNSEILPYEGVSHIFTVS